MRTAGNAADVTSATSETLKRQTKKKSLSRESKHISSYNERKRNECGERPICDAKLRARNARREYVIIKKPTRIIVKKKNKSDVLLSIYEISKRLGRVWRVRRQFVEKYFFNT